MGCVGVNGLMYSTALLRRWDVNIEKHRISTGNAWRIMKQSFCKTNAHFKDLHRLKRLSIAALACFTRNAIWYYALMRTKVHDQCFNQTHPNTTLSLARYSCQLCIPAFAAFWGGVRSASTNHNGRAHKNVPLQLEGHTPRTTKEVIMAHPTQKNKGVIDKFCSIGMERDHYVTMWQMIM